MSKKVKVMVGTTKGGVIFTSDESRKKWDKSDLFFKSWRAMYMTLNPRDGRMHTSVNHFVYGPTTHYSDDLGETWTQATQVPSIPRASKAGRPPGTPDEAEAAITGEKDLNRQARKTHQGVEHHPRSRQRAGRALRRGRAIQPVRLPRPRRHLDSERASL